jgi:hypothetical protein
MLWLRTDSKWVLSQSGAHGKSKDAWSSLHAGNVDRFKDLLPVSRWRSLLRRLCHCLAVPGRLDRPLPRRYRVQPGNSRPIDVEQFRVLEVTTARAVRYKGKRQKKQGAAP